MITSDFLYSAYMSMIMNYFKTTLYKRRYLYFLHCKRDEIFSGTIKIISLHNLSSF